MDTSTLTHEQLLTLARKVHSAAHDADPHRLDFSRRRLADALTAHLEAEYDALVSLSAPRREALLRGQQQLAALLDQLAPSDERSLAAGQSAVADQLLNLLLHQSGAERRALQQARS